MEIVSNRENPKQLRAKERVDLVIAATKKILGESGYGALTLSGVCEIAGIKQTSIYRYWPNREALLTSIANEFEEAFSVEVQKLEDVAFDIRWQDVQRLLLVELARFCEENPWVYGGQGALRVTKSLHPRLDQVISFFSSRYAHLLKIGGLGVRGEDETNVSRTYTEILSIFMLSLEFAEHNEQEIAKIIDRYLVLTVNYLSPYMISDEA